MRKADFEYFFKQNYTRLYYYALQLTGDSEASRDIVSEAFEQAYTCRLDKPDDNMLGYTYRLVHNKSIDHIRRQTAKARYADLYIYGHSDWDDYREAERLDETERQISHIYEIMDRLTPRTREILDLHYFRSLTYEATADRLGISTSAVKKHIVNALKTLRQELLKKSR